MKLMQSTAWRVPAYGIVCALLAGCGSFLPDNHQPVIDSLQVNGQEVKPSNSQTDPPTVSVATGSTVLLSCLAHDPDTDPLTFTWNGGATAAPNTTPANFATFTVPTTDGKTILSCVVRDDRDGIASQAVAIQAVNAGVNHPPTAVMNPAALKVAPGASAPIACSATDPDAGDKLTYTFFAVKGKIVQDSVDPSKATYTAPATTGDDQIFCVVTDGKGSYVTAVATATVQ